MVKTKEGDRVRVVEREQTDEDRLDHLYYDHMAGLVGTVENVYGKDEVVVRVDIDSLGKIPADVHEGATKRMRAKFLDSIGDDQRKLLSKEEQKFVPHYVVLVRSADLEPAPAS